MAGRQVRVARRFGLPAGLVLLFVLHHDFWFWDDPRLLLGALPVGLAYHMAYSVATALFWALVVWHAWPDPEMVDTVESRR